MSPIIITATGQAVDLRYPQLSSISIIDISMHLAQVNRFTGACRRPYSVAEHSLLVCEILERCMAGVDAHGLLAGLMHDAHEAYTNDLASPAKGEVEGWAAFEGRMERTVRARFALHQASHKHAAAIKLADQLAYVTERAQLLPPTPGYPPEPEVAMLQPLGWVNLMAPERQAMNWVAWRNAFEDRFEELDYARNETPFGVAP